MLRYNLNRMQNTLLCEESKAKGILTASFADKEAADCASSVVKFGVFAEENVTDLFNTS